ncbi:MAG: hypothetical protein J0M34_01785 [Alphaproteobacteria bacterium]|nr:hypothetical protein [Alphaproteobacteria bacterium]
MLVGLITSLVAVTAREAGNAIEDFTQRSGILFVQALGATVGGLTHYASEGVSYAGNALPSAGDVLGRVNDGLEWAVSNTDSNPFAAALANSGVSDVSQFACAAQSQNATHTVGLDHEPDGYTVARASGMEQIDGWFRAA